jgi:hypothetical protein
MARRRSRGYAPVGYSAVHETDCQCNECRPLRVPFESAFTEAARDAEEIASTNSDAIEVITEDPLTPEQRRTMDDVIEGSMRVDTEPELPRYLLRPGENPEDRARRNLREELGCDCSTCIATRIQRNAEADDIRAQNETLERLEHSNDPIVISRKDRRESFARMPEACPVVESILLDVLGGTYLNDARHAIDTRIFSQVTSKFRLALNGAIHELHRTQDAYCNLLIENQRLHVALEMRNNGEVHEQLTAGLNGKA